MKNTIDWRKIQDAYPVNKSLIHLNNCGTTPAGSHVLLAVEAMMRQLAAQGFTGGETAPAVLRHRIQSVLSKLLGCLPHEIALTHNTAEGMHFISLGLDLAEGDEILLLEKEYPNNVYPWELWKKRGVKISFVPHGATQEEFLDYFNRALTARTRVASLSAVHWCTGMPFPLAEIARIARERDVLLCLDAAQGAGMVPINMEETGIDIIAFSAWKWLLGPLGCGVLVVRDRAIGRLSSPFKGTDAVGNPGRYYPYQDEILPHAGRYMYSTPGIIDWVYFASSLEFLDTIGFPNVMNRIYELAARLLDGLCGLWFSPVYDMRGRERSGIVVVKKEGTDSHEFSEKLFKSGILCRERLDGLRFGPHVYISETQIDKALEEVARLTQTHS
jgi:selenocysteine lyase/cysteine desulfurase